MTRVKVSPPKQGSEIDQGQAPPPSCEDRRWCRGVSVKSYWSFEHIAHSGGKNDRDDKRIMQNSGLCGILKLNKIWNFYLFDRYTKTKSKVKNLI